MGGGASVEQLDVLRIGLDGEIGLTEEFVAKYRSMIPSPYNLACPTVTREVEALLRANWAAVLDGTSAFDVNTHLTPARFFFNTFYQVLFTTSPSLRNLFRSSMTIQGRALHGTMNTLIMIINSTNFVYTIQTMAEQHLRYGVARAHYAPFGNALLAALETVSGDAWSPAVEQAYVTAYSLLYYVMMPVLESGKHADVADSIPATVVKSERLSSSAKRITLSFEFVLKYHPGDAIWLGIPLESGEVRRHFTLTSFSTDVSDTIVIVVDDIGPASHWLCAQDDGAVVNLYWVESDLRLEIDTPEVLPQHVVFASYGIGCIPFIVMQEGLYRVRHAWEGTVVSLQSAPTQADVDVFNQDVPSSRRPIVWDASQVYFAPTITAEKLQQVAPHIQEAVLYVNGPNDFVKSVRAAWTTAGGDPKTVQEYSFDNNRPFPLSTVALTSLMLTVLTNKTDGAPEAHALLAAMGVGPNE
ncbi:Aste57867_23402 [Aphanomyces stellatus]|uniref:nitric oxide dioxygenase n=1 Tax=Aphanomyces stellatus TaxID=120398 RepID=A0A485LMJ2_9STRA|nr:hypothetical protein As57867_023331 [Aphanomyces stellatus]VFU00048.1 Aste57867_23402 [Aphanomyces stellatus]